MVLMFVDTREPINIRRIACRLGFKQMKLDYGDYSSETCIFERKKIGDLVNSIFARYGGESRLFKQMDKLYAYCVKERKVAFLVVNGTIQTISKEFAARKQKLNKYAIYGAAGSVVTRYDCNIIWVDTSVEDMLQVMRKVAEKVEEGKLMMPKRRRLKEISKIRSVAIVSRALDISPRLANTMVNSIGGLYNILDALKNDPVRIKILDGVGPKTYQKLRSMAGLG